MVDDTLLPSLADFSGVVILLSPLVLSGTLNMIFVKSRLFNSLNIPIDRGYVCKSGHRLLGDNKTWKGFLGMCGLSAATMWVFEFFAKHIDIIGSNSLIPYQSFTPPFNGLFWGFVVGLFYVIFELPNSYLKRRLDIKPGKNVSGFKGFIFTVADQADSVIGVTVCFAFIFPMSYALAVRIVILGTLLHFLVNVFLYSVGLKGQWR